MRYFSLFPNRQGSAARLSAVLRIARSGITSEVSAAPCYVLCVDFTFGGARNCAWAGYVGESSVGGRNVSAKMQNFQLLKILNLLTTAPRKYQ